MFGGLPGAFLDLALLGSLSIVTSSVLLDELDEKLRLNQQVATWLPINARCRVFNSCQVAH